MHLPSNIAIQNFAKSIQMQRTKRTFYTMRWYILLYIISFILTLFLLNLLFPSPAGAISKGPVCAKESFLSNSNPKTETADSGSFIAYVIPTPTAVPLIPTPPDTIQIDTSTDKTNGSGAMENIFMNESGNDPGRWNTSGCVGLGQDCSGRLIVACPNLDYTCEVNYFTNYMQTHIDIDTGRPYGTWENAWSFWQSHSWW